MDTFTIPTSAMEKSLREAHRKARAYFPSEGFIQNPQRVDSIIETHVRTKLTRASHIMSFADTLTDALEKPFAWLLDPIDGHLNEKRQDWHLASTLTLFERGVPIAGLVYNLSSGRMHIASRDQGAFVVNDSGERHHLAHCSSPPPSLREQSASELKQPCLGIMAVIDGYAMSFRKETVDPADVAAAAFIAKYIGLLVTTADGAAWHPQASSICVTRTN